MNTRTVYVNGIRFPYDSAKVLENRGANSASAKVIFKKATMELMGISKVEYVALDEFYSGRLQAKFEFSAIATESKSDESEDELTFVCVKCPSELKR
jgi:hypothetical protein